MNSDRYPLIDHEAEALRAASGRPLREIDLNAAQAGDLESEDLKIDAATLRSQSTVAAEAGYTQLAANLRRAAELTVVPNDELLKIYEVLRPGRASYEALMALAERLESVYEAPINAAFIREAAAAYQSRGLLRRDS
jgi:propanediol dehydratase small subunit